MTGLVAGLPPSAPASSLARGRLDSASIRVWTQETYRDLALPGAMSREHRHGSYMEQRSEVIPLKGPGLPRPRHHSRVRVSNPERESSPCWTRTHHTHLSDRVGCWGGGGETPRSNVTMGPDTLHRDGVWEKPSQGSDTSWTVQNRPGLRFGGEWDGEGESWDRGQRSRKTFSSPSGPRRRGMAYLSRG